MNNHKLAYFNSCAYREFPGNQNKDIYVVFLHGFPADSGKNEDIAEKLSVSEGYSTCVFEYSGLGNSTGEFSLSKSILESQAFIKNLTTSKQINKLVIVGHSWGGLVAINLLGKIPDISEAILLSPFVFLPDENDARTILLDFISHEKEIRKKVYQIEHLMKDFYLVREKYSPLENLELILNRKIKLTIIQADADDVCPLDGAIELKNKLGDNAKLITISAGHWFENRTQLFENIKTSISR